MVIYNSPDSELLKKLNFYYKFQCKQNYINATIEDINKWNISSKDELIITNIVSIKPTIKICN